jgi:Uncharacterised nucleotidyltransferase
VRREPAYRHPSGSARVDSPGLVRQLLAYAASSQRQHSVEPPASGATPGRADERQLRQVVEAGLAPLLYRASREGRVQVPPDWRELLQSADLTAQVRHGNVIDSAKEIVDICNELRVPVTLLKGVSTSDQYYPLAHERAMGDIDILVSEDSRDSVEASLILRGYRRSDYPMDEGAYHGVPLFHGERIVFVEVHTALFPKESALRRNDLFSPAHIASQSVGSTFHGRPIRRLTNELQLVYIASYLLRDLTENGIHPSFLPPLFDLTYLLKASGQSLDWEGLLGWLDNEMAMASLFVVLAYVHRSGLDESVSGILPRLAAGQDIVGPAELRIILAILDNYLIGNKPPPRLLRHWYGVLRATLGTLLTPGSHAVKLLRIPWDVVFPPGAEDRYTFGFHRTRISRLLGGKDTSASQR